MNMFKKNGGFTLVELIVVIAILAILACIAVPAYTGYIEKAEEAADTQVVSAVNTAYAAALTENLLDTTDVDDVTFVPATDSTSASITVDLDDSITDTDGKIAAAVKADFADYFAGNTGKLSYYSNLDYNATKGVFEGVDPS